MNIKREHGDGSSVVLILAVARISHTYLQTYIHRARSLYRYIVMANAALPTFKVDFVGAKQVGKTSLACVRSTLFYHDLSIYLYLSIVIYRDLSIPVLTQLLVVQYDTGEANTLSGTVCHSDDGHRLEPLVVVVVVVRVVLMARYYDHTR